MHPLEQLKLELSTFWSHFGGTKCTGRGYDQATKLAVLKEYASRRIYFKNRQSLLKRRTQFNSVKSHRHQFRSHKQCFVCLDSASVRHHIIQLQNGGSNAKKNIVSLCDACHAKVHPWLRK